MGLAYVAPIGIQNLYVINSALAYSRGRALIIAAIVAFFDISLAVACFCGVGVVLARYPVLSSVMTGGGGVVVVYIGASLWWTKASDEGQPRTSGRLGEAAWQAFVVTWLNPQAIIDGTMMLGAFSSVVLGLKGLFFISGVATASLSWFLVVTMLVSSFEGLFSPQVRRWLNIVCGIVIVAYGCTLLGKFIGGLW